MSLEEHGIYPPPGSTGEIRMTCPQCSGSRKKHDDKCLSVNIDDGVWHCFHCGWAGSVSSNGGKVYVKPKYEPEPKLPEKVIDWFKSRGISERVLIENKIGYGQSFQDKNAIQFPYFKGGHVVNIKHRTGDKQFRQEKDAEKCFYRFDNVCDGSETLIITEGEIDALSCCEAGLNYVVSIPDGAPSANSKSFRTKFDFIRSAEKLLGQFQKIILAVDNDEPGQRAEEELSRRIGAEKCYRVEYPEGCKDLNDVLVNHGTESILDVVKAARPYPVSGIIEPLDMKGRMSELWDKGLVRGASTGWKAIDEIYTVKPCEMTVVTGIPGSGKSNWIDNLMLNLSLMHGWSHAVFRPENWPIERHLQTLLEKLCELPFAKPFKEWHPHGTKTIERMPKDVAISGLKELNDYFHFIVPEDELMTVDTILEKARIAIFRYGVKGIVIDPWNEVEHQFHGLREDQYISLQLTKIRQFARKNGVHIWVVAHPRNLRKDDDGGYKPPTMYEISGGAHWRNKADNGICVHRPNYQKDEVKIIVQKIRFREVGKIGEADLKYIRATGKYEDFK
jgi:twinkle protein